MNEIRNLVMREKEQSVSAREWRHRLAGYGYRLDETDTGTVVRSITRDEALLTL